MTAPLAALCCVLAFVLLAISGAWADPPTIRVVTEEYPPYNYRAANGDVTGLSTAIVAETLRTAGLDHTIALLPWAEAYDIALGQENVLIFSMFRSGPREPMFHWIGSVAPFSASLYAEADSRIRLRTLEDAKVFRIGTITNNFLENHLVSKGYDLRPQDRAGDVATNLDRVLEGRIDLVILPDLVAAHYFRQPAYRDRFRQALPLTDLQFSTLYMAMSRSTGPEVLEKVRAAFAAIRHNGFYEQTMRRWGMYGGPDR